MVGRRHPKRSISRSRPGFRELPFLALAVITIAALWATIEQPHAKVPPIHSDGLGYYAWNDAILSWNFDFCDSRSWAVPLSSVGAIGVPNPSHPGRCENQFAPGLALLRFPVMGSIAVIADGSEASPSHISEAEQDASEWLSVLALLVSVAVMGLTLRRVGVGRWLSDAALLAACFGTGVFHYATLDGAFTHIYSVALFSTLILLGATALEERREPNRVAVGILALFIGLVRAPDVVPLLMLAAAWIAARLRQVPEEERVRLAGRSSLPVILGLAPVACFQLLYTRWASGIWSASTYGNVPFKLTDLDELRVLLSYNHGLFLWYPVIAVFLVSGFATRQSRPWALVGAGAAIGLTVVYGSWAEWDMGGAMGQRGFVDIVPVLVLAGGVGWAAMPRRFRWVPLVAAAVCTVVTLELMAGYWRQALPYQNNTGQQYWSTVTGSQSLLQF